MKTIGTARSGAAFLSLCVSAGILVAGHVSPRAAVGTTRLVAPGGTDTGDCSAAACATVNYAIGQSVAGDVVSLAAGTYDEDVTVDVPGITIHGAAAVSTTIRGPIGGSVSTVLASAAGVIVEGLTITRAGNTVADWNNAALNSAGVAVQGPTASVEVRNCVITGNRTGIDINNSNGNFVHNNVITNNRTGLLFRNQTDDTVVVENEVTGNWTVGVLFLDGSGGTNTPVQSALNSTFTNNNISGNWYGQIVDRQSGGSLPAPGTTNMKNFRGNWLGTKTPTVTTANSAEPGYAAQIPVVFGGTASPPNAQPEIAGPASANFVFRPLLKTGTDTNHQTVPGRGTFGFQGEFKETIREPQVSRQAENTFPLKLWTLYTRNVNSTGTFVSGPDVPPLGTGSHEFVTTGPLDKVVLFNYEHVGTPIASINALSYSTYRQTGTASQLPSINIEINPNGPNNEAFATLVFEPVYNTDQDVVANNSWQTWDAFNAGAGVWWSTRDLKDAAGNLVACDPNGSTAGCEGKYFVSWSTIVTGIPNAFIVGGFGVNQGSGGDALDAAFDKLVIGVPSYRITYDFDPMIPATLTLSNLVQAFTGTPRPVTVTTTPTGIAGVTVTYNGSTTAPTDLGDYDVVASLTSDVYEAEDATGTLTIFDNRAEQIITAKNIPDKTTTTAPFTLTASATSKLPVTFAAAGQCTVGTPTVSGKYFTATITVANTPGSCTITLDQAGNANWAPVTLESTFEVNKTSQKITFTAPASKFVTDSPVDIEATATSGLPVTFTSLSPVVCSVEATTPSHASVTLHAAGTCSITASQTGNATYLAAPEVNKKIIVSAALSISSLTFTPSSVIGGCGAVSAVGKVVLSAAASVDTVVTLSSLNPALATVGGSVVVLKGKKAATFDVATANVATKLTATIRAELASGSFKEKALAINPVAVVSLVLSEVDVAGGDVVTATIGLNCEAPAGGVTVTLSSSSPLKAQFDATSVFIDQGLTEIDVDVTTFTTPIAVTAKLTATGGGQKKSVILTINP